MTRRPFLLRAVEGLRPIPSTDLAVTELDQLGHNGHDRAEDDKRHQQPGQRRPVEQVRREVDREDLQHPDCGAQPDRG